MILSEKIHEIVEENSGGIKFIELLTHVIEWAHESGDISTNDMDNFPDVLEAEIRRSDDVKILTYHSKKWNRKKMFVYTP